MAYTAPSYITLQDLQRRCGVQAIVQLFDDDGDNVADAFPVAALIEEGSASLGMIFTRRSSVASSLGQLLNWA